MRYVDTFLTTLYVIVDDFCQSQLIKQDTLPGTQSVLSGSEAVTLALFGELAQFWKSNVPFIDIPNSMCDQHFPRCQIAVNSSGCNNSMQRPSRNVFCT